MVNVLFSNTNVIEVNGVYSGGIEKNKNPQM